VWDITEIVCFCRTAKPEQPSFKWSVRTCSELTEIGTTYTVTQCSRHSHTVATEILDRPILTSVCHRSPWQPVGCCCWWSYLLRASIVSQQLMMTYVTESRCTKWKETWKCCWTTNVTYSNSFDQLWSILVGRWVITLPRFASLMLRWVMIFAQYLVACKPGEAPAQTQRTYGVRRRPAVPWRAAPILQQNYVYNKKMLLDIHHFHYFAYYSAR